MRITIEECGYEGCTSEPVTIIRGAIQPPDFPQSVTILIPLCEHHDHGVHSVLIAQAATGGYRAPVSLRDGEG